MNLQEATILAAGTVIPFGGTEAAPNVAGVGATVGPFADYTVSFSYRITNGATPPGTGVTLIFYGVSAAGRLYELDRVTGSVIASDSQSGSITVTGAYPSYTAKAFGNTSQNVTVEVYLARQVP
jgi:hypothetical protein